MKAHDFYRILSRVRGMRWELVNNPKREFGTPAGTRFIRGTRHSFFYSPLSAVASAVRRDFVDVGNARIRQILNLHPDTYRRIRDATYQNPGYSPQVRRTLLRICGDLHE